MKQVEIDGNGKNSYGLNSRISFALISSPSHGRKQLQGLENCRDYINDLLISFFNETSGNVGSHHWRNGDVPVDTTRLRIAFAKSLSAGETEETLHKKMLSAKRIINMYEKVAGFKHRSIIVKAKHSSDKIKLCWLLTGPPEWLKSSNLVSMITLIFRIVVTYGGFENLSNLEKVEGRFKELCDKYKNMSNDCGYLLAYSWPKFRMLMECYDDLFRSKTESFWYPAGKVRNWHSSGGIASLCKHETQVSDIDNLTSEVYKKWIKDKKGS